MMLATEETWQLDLGATPSAKGTTFRVWAPHHLSLLVEIEGRDAFRMTRDEMGYFTSSLPEVKKGERYFFRFENGLKRPDPVSRSLPQGLHGATEIVDSTFAWDDREWKGIPRKDLIFYELHVGTFSSENSFEGVIDRLPYLKDLGITCIELMPIAEFPGRWNWGYDGASLYCPYSGYGGVNGLKGLVDACHKNGMAVCLDVVYNHLGPEGNYLAEFGPYFSDRYHTPWGKGLNYDEAESDHVRHFVIQNALYWVGEYHIDALRLDAIHGIYDFSATPMLSELTSEVEKLSSKLGREIHIVAESDRNDVRMLRPREGGGMGLCALWNDDFHHALHVSLTGERHFYYQDFEGLPDLAKAIQQGFVYDGQYSPFRKKHHGNPSREIPHDQFIVFLQNHDQIGNSPLGDRLVNIIDEPLIKVGAVITLLTPSLPLLFMGQEYGETGPFEYFVDFENKHLMQTIHEGRKREFHRLDMPYPGEEPFQRSHLTWKINEDILTFYKHLISIRKQHPPTYQRCLTYHGESWVAWEYQTEKGKWLGVLCHFGAQPLTIPLPFAHCLCKSLLLGTKSEPTLTGKTITLPSKSAAVWV